MHFLFQFGKFQLVSTERFLVCFDYYVCSVAIERQRLGPVVIYK